MGIFADLLGTTKAYFKIGVTGVRLKNSSGNLLVRNTGDSADSQITTSQLNNSGETVVLNSDAAGSGADWKINLARPTSGMTADLTLTLPINGGTSGYVLSTNGSGTTSWVAAGSTTQCDTVDTTDLAYNSGSSISMFTLPANAVVDKVQVVVDTAFDSTPTATVGISADHTKYVGSGDNDLTAAAGTVFEIHPGITADGSTEALVIYYSAASASVGAARVLIYYSIPN